MLRVFLLLFVAESVSALGTIQSVGVNGSLICNGKPAASVKVKLYDVDFADPDDLLKESRSDKKGLFHLEGTTEEIGRIDPKLNIYHNCQDEHVECLRKVEIQIPKDFVVDGKKAKKIFDIGILNLNAIYPGESRDCLN